MIGHFGQDNTFEYMKHFYFWPRMRTQAQKFVEKCAIYQHAKGKSQNTSLYIPLSIPNRPWDSINMDFVLDMPKIKMGYDSIFVVVDRFLKMAHFIPCFNTSDATHTSIFSKEFVRLHGLPRNIVSDRDTKFRRHFWNTLWKIHGIDLNYGSIYHP